MKTICMLLGVISQQWGAAMGQILNLYISQMEPFLWGGPLQFIGPRDFNLKKKQLSIVKNLN